MEITAFCPICKEPTVWTNTHTTCSQGHPLLNFQTDHFLQDGTLNQCPICGCPHIYQQKDFNRKVGVGLIVIGVLFAYFTYGISLVLVTLIDWLLIRKVGSVGICYRCDGQFRKSDKVNDLPGFNLSLFDYYRNIKLSGL